MTVFISENSTRNEIKQARIQVSALGLKSQPLTGSVITSSLLRIFLKISFLICKNWLKIHLSESGWEVTWDNVNQGTICNGCTEQTLNDLSSLPFLAQITPSVAELGLRNFPWGIVRMGCGPQFTWQDSRASRTLAAKQLCVPSAFEYEIRDFLL